MWGLRPPRRGTAPAPRFSDFTSLKKAVCLQSFSKTTMVYIQFLVQVLSIQKAKQTNYYDSVISLLLLEKIRKSCYQMASPLASEAVNPFASD